MTESTPLEKCAVNLRRTRNHYLLSQIATLDLVSLSETEASKLDRPAYRHQRLADLLGKPEMDSASSEKLYRSVRAFVDSRKDRSEPVLTEGEHSRDSVRLPTVTPESLSGTKVSTESKYEESPVPNKNPEIAVFDNLIESFKSAGLPSRALSPALRIVIKIEAERSRSELLLESLFISAVSQFEAYISSMISASLNFDPNPLKESERRFGFKDIVDLPDIQGFVDMAVEAYVDSMMRESMEKWMKFLGKVTRTDTTWVVNEINEAIMRRHVHVHFGGRASPQYIEAVGSRVKGIKADMRLPITHEYLQETLDKLAVVAVTLTQAALFALSNSKAAKEISWDDCDEGIIQTTFDLLAAGRHNAVAPLFDRLDEFLRYSVSREYVRTNSLHASKKLHGLSKVESQIEAWDVSSSAAEIVLAKYCLLEEIDEAERAFDTLRTAGTLSVLELSTWPVLEPLRDRIGVGATVSDHQHEDLPSPSEE